MIRGIHHTAISTPDIERLRAFYCDVVGFKVAWETGWDRGNETADRIVGLKDSSARVIVLEAGNMYIELFQYESPTPNAGDPQRPVCDHGVTHVCLDVVSVDDEYQRLRDAGMEFHAPPQDIFDFRATYGRDPDGNVIEILEVPDSSPIRPLEANMRGERVAGP